MRNVILAGVIAGMFAAQGGASVCPDFDGNDAVDQTDLLVMIANWGSCDGCSSDIDNSGETDINDMLILLSSWGPCPSSGDGQFNYGEALQTALLFYEAQRVGAKSDFHGAATHSCQQEPSKSMAPTTLTCDSDIWTRAIHPRSYYQYQVQ